MDWLYFIYLLLLALSALLTINLAFFALGSRRVPAFIALIWLMVGLAEWSVSNIFLQASQSTLMQAWMVKLRMVGVAVVPTAFLAFALSYTNRKEWLKHPRLVVLVSIPIITLLLAWTNDWHGLFWKQLSFYRSTPFLIAVSTYNIWFWVFLVYVVLVFLLGVWLLLRDLLKRFPLNVLQVFRLILAGLLPWLGVTVYLARCGQAFAVDWISIACTLSCLVLFIGSSPYRFIDTLPLAHIALIEDMAEGVLELDSRDRIVSINPAAERMLGIVAQQAIGTPIKQWLPDWDSDRDHLTLGEPPKQRFYLLHRLQPFKVLRWSAGRLIVLDDVTEYKRIEEGLRQSEANYRALIEAMPDTIVYYRRDGTLLAVKDPKDYLPTSDRHEIIGRNIMDINPVLGPKVLACLEQAIITGKTQILEYEARRGEVGEYREARYSAINENEVVAIIRDITGARRAEEALRQSEARYRAIVEEQADLIERWRPDLTITFVNEAWCKVHGGSPQDWVGRSMLSCVCEEDRERNAEYLADLLQRKPDNPYGKIETRRIMPDGGVRWFQWSDRVIFDERGNIVEIQSVGRDVTDRVLAEEGLKRRVREIGLLNRVIAAASSFLETPEKIMQTLCTELAQAFGLPQAAYAELSQDRQFLKVVAEYLTEGRPSAIGTMIPVAGNPAAEYTLECRLPLSISDFPKEAEPLEVKDVARQRGVASMLILPVIVRSEVIGTIGLDSLTPRTFTAEEISLAQSAVSAASHAIENARLYAALQSELAERKKAEEALRQKAAELARSNDDLQQFASVASHDLQEPLRKMISFIDLLRERHASTLDAQAIDYFGRIQSAAGRMRAMIQALLALSRVASSDGSFVPTDLNRVLQDVLSDFEIRIQESGAQVQVESLPTIEADPIQMNQLFANLLNNALKFHQPDQAPRIEIVPQPSPRDDFVRISFRDYGIGFDEKYLDIIFQPFRRLHDRREYEGTGMGLAICRRIVERHGGGITAQSTPGQGATFIVDLPISHSGSDGIRGF